MSRIFKSYLGNPSSENQKVISLKVLHSMHQEEEEQSLLLLQLDSEKQEIISRAKAEAASIIEEAERQAQSVRQQISLEKDAWEQEKQVLMDTARQEGFAQGLAEGKEQGYKECEEAIDFAKEVVDTAKKDYQQQIASAEKTILELGIRAAEKILGEKLNEDEEAYLSIVKRTLREAREYREIQLHVRPCYYSFVLSKKEELAAIFPKETDIYVYPDDELAETDCLIESANGRIDGSADSQLEELRKKLLDLLESDSGESSPSY